MYKILNKHNQIYFLMLWMALVPLGSSAFITVLIYKNELLFQSFTLIQWCLLFLLSAFTMALAITPTTYIALVSGYFVGYWGIIPLAIAYQTASIIGYFLAKKIDRGLMETLIRKYPKASNILDRVEKNQFTLTILSRLSPALPFALMNVVLSTSKIRLSQFFWGGLIGMLPRSIFFIWIGVQTSKLTDALNGQENIYISIGLTIVVVLVIYKILTFKKD